MDCLKVETMMIYRNLMVDGSRVMFLTLVTIDHKALDSGLSHRRGWSMKAPMEVEEEEDNISPVERFQGKKLHGLVEVGAYRSASGVVQKVWENERINGVFELPDLNEGADSEEMIIDDLALIPFQGHINVMDRMERTVVHHVSVLEGFIFCRKMFLRVFGYEKH